MSHQALGNENLIQPLRESCLNFACIPCAKFVPQNAHPNGRKCAATLLHLTEVFRYWKMREVVMRQNGKGFFSDMLFTAEFLTIHCKILFEWLCLPFCVTKNDSIVLAKIHYQLCQEIVTSKSKQKFSHCHRFYSLLGIAFLVIAIFLFSITIVVKPMLGQSHY